MNSALGYAKANPDAAAAALQNTAKWAAENPETVRLKPRLQATFNIT